MQYRRLGNGPLEGSELSFGTWLTVAGGVAREQAIRFYRLCNELVVTWYLDRVAHDTQGELRTAIGKFGAHSIHVRAKTTGKAIQHVTDQLRRLG